MNEVQEITDCRICHGEIETVLDLGKIYPSSFVPDGTVLSEDEKIPLVLVKCKECDLVQLKHSLNQDSMYRQYWYLSSLNPSMVASLQEVVNDVESRVELGYGDVVLDIGSNDNTMLNQYTNKTLITVGIDPALNLERKPCNFFVNDYFTAENYHKVVYEKAKVITAIAMFYDLPDPTAFVKDIVSILDEKGIFVIQLTDLFSMMEVNAFDNVCTEHLEYYSLKVIKNLFASCGLEIIDVSYNKVNGGSLRVIAAFPGVYPVVGTVDYILKVEEDFFSKVDRFKQLQMVIETTKMKMKQFCQWAKLRESRVFVMGASTKGNTLLQVCEITEDDIQYASEVNPEKFGLRTIGSNIKIISEDSAIMKHPEYMILLPWHFKSSILLKEKVRDYLEGHGKIVIPLPRFSVISFDREFFL